MCNRYVSILELLIYLGTTVLELISLFSPLLWLSFLYLAFYPIYIMIHLSWPMMPTELYCWLQSIFIVLYFGWKIRLWQLNRNINFWFFTWMMCFCGFGITCWTIIWKVVKLDIGENFCKYGIFKKNVILQFGSKYPIWLGIIVRLFSYDSRWTRGVCIDLKFSKSPRWCN